MTPEQYLKDKFHEEVPEWLQNFGENSKFNAKNFFASRVVYYPGSGNDGHAVKVFGASHSAHCFVYVDYSVSSGSIKEALSSLRHKFSGYRSFARVELKERDISPDGWQSHATAEETNAFRAFFDFKSPLEVQSFGFLEVLEREAELDDSHGPHRLAILFLGADGVATYDALFCQEEQNAPFAILLQDHGWGGNYTRFGQDGVMSEIASRTNRKPQLLLIGSGTEAWHGFERVDPLEPTFGGWAGFPRLLYQAIEEKNTESTTVVNLESSQDVDIKLKKYYVYALIDSRFQEEPTLGIFYIGKGTNKRVLEHVRSVNSMTESYELNEDINSIGDSKEKTADDADETLKVKRIKEIHETGAKVIECILGRFDTAAEAFAVEAVLIDWVYGRSKLGGILTNIQAGRYSQHIRNKGDMGENERLDIPRKIRVESIKPDGTKYIETEWNKLLRNNIPDIVDAAILQLRGMVLEEPSLNGLVEISEPTIFEYGRYLGARVQFGEDDVIIRLQFTSKNLITNLRAAAEDTTAGRNRFAERMLAVGLQPSNDGHYGWMPAWYGNRLVFDDYETVIERIKAAARHFGHL